MKESNTAGRSVPERTDSIPIGYREDSVMNKKMEEMIALGVSYGINCTACMEYHGKAALEAGLTEEEMREAIRVGKRVKAGAAKKTEAVAEELFREADEGACCPAGSECCLEPTGD